MLSDLTRRIGRVLENRKPHSAARRHAWYLEAAGLIVQRLTALLDTDSLTAEMVRLIGMTFDCYHTGILLVDQEAGEVVLGDTWGQTDDYPKAGGLRLKIGLEGIVGRTAKTGRTFLCNDVSREKLYYPTELLPATRSELAVPLRVGSRTIGVLDLQSNRLDAFVHDEVVVLEVLGGQLGIAIENARLFQETKRRFDAMIGLHQTSLDIISQLDRTELLAALLKRGVGLLNAEASSLFLYDANNEIIYNVANHNTFRDWTGVTLRPGEGVIGQVILRGKPVIVNDYRNWAGKPRLFANDPYTMVMGVPLKWLDETVGAIIVGNVGEDHRFDRNDLWLLNLFADLAAIAIKNAELHTRTKEFSHELERQVEERTREASEAKEEISVKAQQLQLLLDKTIRIQEEEQARIARDMHDGVIQLITAARYELRAAKIAARSGHADDADKKLSAVRQLLDDMEKEIRSAVYDLHPPDLNTIGLVPTLRKHVANFEKVSGIKCHVEVNGAPCFRLTELSEVAVFRIVQEALHNVDVHARASVAWIVIDYRPTSVSITVADDGDGFDNNQWVATSDAKHLGLIGMRERMLSVGGELEVFSAPGHGTRVSIRLPKREDGTAADLPSLCKQDAMANYRH